MNLFNKILSRGETQDTPLLPDMWQMPIAGEVIPLSSLPDQAFAEGMMGQGFAIKAKGNTVVSPVNGKVVSIFPGGHALAIISDNGCELLIHVGIDTVGLKGEGFTTFVETGDSIQIGDALVEVDFELLEQKVPDSSVIIVFTEIEDGAILFENQQLKWKG